MNCYPPPPPPHLPPPPSLTLLGTYAQHDKNVTNLVQIAI